MKNQILFRLFPIGIMVVLFSTGENLSAQVVDLQTAGLNRWGRINPTPGFNAQSVGIGNFNSPTNVPTAALHVNKLLLPPSPAFNAGQVFRTDATNAVANIWAMYSGGTAATTNEKGAIFTGGYLNTRPNDFCIRVTQNSPFAGGDLVFYTQGTLECMRIKGTQGGGSQVGFVGINRVSPLSMLHIDGAPISANPNSNFAAGWRPWMRVGVFNQWDSDGLFVGLKDEGSNRKDAVIAWSDDGPNFGSDYLRFIFTNNVNAPVSQGGGPDGIEVGRWSPINGYLGIGDYYSSSIKDPAVRLEILQNPNIPLNSPSFRITQVQQNPSAAATTGVFTDMYTSFSGDLIILPSNNTQPIAADRRRFVGINTSTPGNTLEINSQAAGPAVLNGITATSSGFSGLRFSDLKYGVSVAATPLANQGVLSVNANGDVVYVAGSSGGFGPCTAPPVLGAPSGIDLNGNSLSFLDPQLSSKVTIGTNCTNSTRAKLIVEQSSGSTLGTIGIHVTNTDQSPTRIVYGVFSQVIPVAPTSSDLGYTAGFFFAHGSKENRAVEGLADGLGANDAINIAGRFVAKNGKTNYAIYAESPINIGVNFAGYFNGDVVRTGTDNFTPDINLKQNIDSIPDATGIIALLHPKTFFFDTIVHPQMYLPTEKQWGLIAQDVETVLPELVSEAAFPAQYDTAGNISYPAFNYKTLNYNAFIAILIKGMQEQQQQLDSLQNQISSCCTSNARTQNPDIDITDVTLTNTENVVLNQNIPNPFAEQTTITYFLPDNVQEAQLLFYDAQGKLIKAIDLAGRGNGQINVFADDLSNGIYTYALVIDGQVADSKKMMKTK